MYLNARVVRTHQIDEEIRGLSTSNIRWVDDLIKYIKKKNGSH